jgi:hypothetical protein
VDDRPEDVAAKETRRLRELQRIVDRVEGLLRRGGLSAARSEELIAEAREACRRLFPDKLDVFDLIYLPRFQRAMAEAPSPDSPPSPGDVG